MELTFKVLFDGTPKEKLDIRAYAFDRRGRFLSSSRLQDGATILPLPDELAEAHSFRLFFAPPLLGNEGQERKERPTLKTMERLNAYEPSWQFNPRQTHYELLPIPPIYWQHWFICFCRVRGQVVKPVVVNGVVVNRPVCHARVHICEVDRLPIFILHLPDPFIYRLRDDLLHLLLQPKLPVPPIPDPGPLFELDKARLNPALIAAFNPQPDPSGFNRLAQVALNPQPLPPREAAALQTEALQIQLPAQTLVAMSSNSSAIVRQSLIDNLQLIRPYLCYLDWIWPFYYLECEELQVVETDAQGHFDTTILYLCGDHPDLYFWVEYAIGGTWATVYRPGLACHTYWNYACGSEVTIVINDARVPACSELPSVAGVEVVVVSIGANVNVSKIDSNGLLPDSTAALGSFHRPFAGSIEPHVWFGDGLRTAGINLYRWSYKAQSASDFHAMTQQVIRNYLVTGSDGIPRVKPYVLGPKVIGDGYYFEVPPENPPEGGEWIPEWDVRANSASAYWATQLEPKETVAGELRSVSAPYDLKLEFFQGTLDGSGNYTSASSVSLPTGALKVPPANIAAPSDPSGTALINAPAANLILDGAGNIAAYKLTLHIDNNPCQAEIFPTQVAGNAAGPCGFIGYVPPATSASAHVSFKARHPYDFASFNFETVKGSSGDIAVACASALVSQNDNGFTRNSSSVFAKDITVADLVAGCEGGKGAFGETLYVTALATNGWDYLGLDANPTPKAYALEPNS